MQKALALNEKFGSQSVVDWAIPNVDENDVLIKIESAGLNPVDFKIVKYGIFIQQFPTVLGSDGAGVVTKVGSKVKSHKVGDRVFFQGQIGNIKTSTFQQYASVPADYVNHLPDNISFDEGASLGVSGSTASISLFKLLGIKPPYSNEKQKKDFILIWGATTSVGIIAIQLAKLSGLRVITAASPKSFDFARGLGAEFVIDYKAADALAQIRAITGDSLIYAFDTVGAATAQIAYDALSTSLPSKLALIASEPKDIKNLSPNKSAEKAYGSVFASPETALPFWAHAPAWLKDGSIKPSPIKVIGGLKDIVKAQEDQAAGKVSGVKLISRNFE